LKSNWTIARDAIQIEQDKVWAHDWFAHFPPTIKELAKY
jgi:hypothetical protein